MTVKTLGILGGGQLGRMSAQAAEKLGIKTIEADNEENNPMFKLNLQLGFKPQRAYLDFQKKIPDES